METLTDKELIEELASRHDELIVIRPKASNMAGEDKLLILVLMKNVQREQERLRKQWPEP